MPRVLFPVTLLTFLGHISASCLAHHPLPALTSVLPGSMCSRMAWEAGSNLIPWGTGSHSRLCSLGWDASSLSPSLGKVPLAPVWHSPAVALPKPSAGAGVLYPVSGNLCLPQLPPVVVRTQLQEVGTSKFGRGGGLWLGGGEGMSNSQLLGNILEN